MALSSLAAGLMVFTLAIYLWLLALGQRVLASRPYCTYRVSNIAVRLQYQTRSLAAAFFVLSQVLFWWIGTHNCTSYLET
jgi:hypothetical protein